MAKKKKAQAKKTTSIKKSFLADERVRIITGAFTLCMAIYIFISIISYFFTWQSDQSKLDISFIQLFTNSNINVENWTGKLGAFISHILIHDWFGVASLSIVLILAIIGLRLLQFKVLPIKKTTLYAVIITIWISVALGYIFHNSAFLPGGAHGYFLSKWLNAFAGKIGTAFLLIISLFGILIFSFDSFLDNLKIKIKALFNKSKKIVEEKAFILEDEEVLTPDDTEEDKTKNKITEVINDEPKPQNTDPIDDVTNTDNEEISFEITNTVENKEEEKHSENENNFNNIATIEVKTIENDSDKQEDIDDLLGLKVEDTTNKEEEEEISFEVEIKEDNDIAKKISNTPLEDYDPTLDLSNYKFPPISLLPEHKSDNQSVTPEELKDNKNRIVETLGNYKIEIVDIKAIVGPTITLYEIVPAAGVRISKIKNLEDDIALSLAALGIRIIAPIPGKGTIGIEVPNLKPKTVSMRSVIASKTFQDTKYELPLALGKTISNETYVIDLAKMPHMLVAGATGQGKSVGLNAILTSLLYKKHPAQLKMVLVDPKKVELTLYQKIEKHFLAMLPDSEEAIITDTQKVVHTLNSLCIEMDTRYDLLKAAKVRNIKEYNQKFISRKLNPENGHRYLPYIVVVIDEFADLIMTAGKEVELPIARLAQLARAIGIHLIIATQRPTTNIITGLIKANFPARIAFRVTSMVDSRTILDSPGANQLIGRGDMLISQGSDMVRLQCAFVDTPELEQITDFIGDQQGYPMIYELPEYVDENEISSNETDLSKRDALFEEAARLIVATQQGSTSSIQRKFSIGYNRAGRIVDQLHAAGIVGPFEGSKARQVLIPDEISLEQLLKSLP